MEKAEIIAILEDIAALLELKGENPFKALAYTKAARALNGFDGDLGSVIDEGKLGEKLGLGEALREKITTLHETGRLEYYENLRASVHPGLFALLEIPALGPKKIKVLHERLGITSVEALETACRAGKVRGLSGFGAKTEEKILAGIEQARNYAAQFIHAAAWSEAEELRDALREHPAVGRLSIAGSLRRGRETVKDIDLVASSRDPAAVMDFFTSLPGIKQVTAHGETKSSILLASGIAVDLRVVGEAEYAFALHHFTGSKEHNVEMRQRAIARGRKLSEWGLFEVKRGKKKSEAEEGKLVPCRTEEELFAALDLAYIPPELREGLGEIEAAEKGELPRLIEWTQLRGTFHCHNQLERRQEHARRDGRRGARAGARLSRHRRPLQVVLLRQRPGRGTARRTDRDDRKAQRAGAGLPRLRGSEVDILKDGQLDFGDDVLQQLDYVVASVHNLMTQDEATMTARMIRAMENEHVTMLGHATGRRLLEREASQVNLAKIIDCAARTGTWIELNCSASRQDMDWRWWRRARDLGVKCVINPDAHRVSQFGFLRHGVTLARKGWLRREDVMNTRTLKEIRAALR